MEEARTLGVGRAGLLGGDDSTASTTAAARSRALRIAAGRAASRRSRRSAGTERELPAQLVLLAMGFLHPEQALLEQFGVERDPRGNVKAVSPYTTSVAGRVRRRGRPPRAVADRVGDQRGPSVRAHGRPLPGGLPPASAPRMTGWPATPTPTRAPRARRSTRVPASASPRGRRPRADLLPPQPLHRALPDLQQDLPEHAPPAGRAAPAHKSPCARAPPTERARTRGAPDGCARDPEGRAADDGFQSDLVPGVRASQDAERLAEEIAFASGRLLALAADPPGPVPRARDLGPGTSRARRPGSAS